MLPFIEALHPSMSVVVLTVISKSSKRNGARYCTRPRSNGAAVISAMDNPLTSRSPSCYDTYVMRPDHNSSDRRSTGVRANARPHPGDRETRIRDAKIFGHVAAAPRSVSIT
jgi:hypothetical protein